MSYSLRMSDFGRLRINKPRAAVKIKHKIFSQASRWGRGATRRQEAGAGKTNRTSDTVTDETTPISFTYPSHFVILSDLLKRRNLSNIP